MKKCKACEATKKGGMIQVMLHDCDYAIYKPGQPLLQPKGTPKEDHARFLMVSFEYIAKWVEPVIRKKE